MRYLFEDFEFDTDRRELHRGTDLVSIEPLVFDLLDYLIRNRERVASKDDLINAVWNGRFVSEAALTTRLNAARTAIGDTGQKQRLIKTLPRKGLRFVGTVREAQRLAVEPLGCAAPGGDTKPASAPRLPDKPSIAVLAFQNMSGDPEQEYFADGIVDDIITALSRFKSLFVIARNSSFTYKGKPVDIKQVGRQLGVRYVLEGSVRKAGNRVRISGQLIEAATNNHLWADKFDGAIEDIFSLQDQVTAAVVGLIAPAVERAEIERAKRKPTDRLDSYDLYLRGVALLLGGSLVEARTWFTRAIEKDPEYGMAYAYLALTYTLQQSLSGSPLSEEERSEAIRLANSAANLAADDAFSLAVAGHALTYIGHSYDRGLSMTAEAVVLNANLAIAWQSRGWVALTCDEPERAIESFDRLLRISPLDPTRRWAWNGMAFALFCLGRHVEGCEWAARAVQFRAEAHSLGALIINSIGADRIGDARDAVVHLLKLRPGFRASHSVEAFPFRSAATRDRILKAFQASGLPP